LVSAGVGLGVTGRRGGDTTRLSDERHVQQADNQENASIRFWTMLYFRRELLHWTSSDTKQHSLSNKSKQKFA